MSLYTIIIALILLMANGNFNENHKNTCSSNHRCRCKQLQDSSIKADCSGLHMKFIPRFYGNISFISLDRNNLTSFYNDGEIPSTVVTLILSNNQISEFQMNPFQNFERLKYLNLMNNYLKYEPSVISPGIFTGLKSLKSLNLQNNLNMSSSLVIYPKAITEISTLSSLAVDGKRNAVFDPSFKHLHQLEQLSLSGISGKCDIELLSTGLFIATPFLRNLDVSGCELTQIQNGTFRFLTQLEHLNISHNKHLTFRILSNITHDLQYTDIKVFDFSKIHCTYGPGTILFTDDIKYLKNTKVEQLYFGSNRIVAVDNEFILNLPKTLKKISMRDNRLTMGGYILTVAAMTGLEIFDGNQQYTSHNPTSDTNRFYLCEDWRGPKNTKSKRKTYKTEAYSIKEANRNPTDTHFNYLFKYFVDTHRGYNANVHVILPLPPKLSVLTFESCKLKYLIPELYFSPINSISYISLRNNIFFSWQGPVHNLKSVKYADLSNNFCSNISSFFGSDFQNLKVLNVSKNLLGLVLNENSKVDPFRNLSQLELLDLSFNRIKSLPRFMFKYQYNLEILNLSSNLLTELNFDIGQLKKMQYLDLSKNQIPLIPKPLRKHLIKWAKSGNFTINLMENQIRCDCNETSLEFLKWISKTQKEYGFFKYYDQHSCIAVNYAKVYFSFLDDQIAELERQCSSYASLIIGGIVAIVLCVISVIGGIVYRYRWKLTYMYYMAKHTRNLYQRDDGTFTYHAFVSYANEDMQFVQNDFTEAIENRHHLKMCFHGRDFTAGVPIRDNIINAIHNSRKTIIILSPDFLKSDWCNFEFNMARMESIYSRATENVLLLILYRQVPKKDLPLELFHLLRNDCYIEYPNDVNQNNVFWERVALAISSC